MAGDRKATQRKEAFVAELNARDTKLVQYLNEALTKEKQLEQALQAHIAMTTLAPYRKRLQQHLSETKRHAREVERRVKRLGGTSEGISGVVQEAASVVQDVAAKGAAMAQGPVHMVRGTSEQEVLLKNARTEFKEEAEEIAHYTAIQRLAESVGDRDTAQLAKAILREEKRMAGFLEKLIPRLTSSVVQAEIPRSQRNGGRRRRSTTSRSTSSRKRTTTARKRTTTARKRTTTARKRTTTSRKRATSSRSGSTSRARASSGRARTTGRSGTTKRTTARSSSARRSGATRKASGRKTSGRKTTARSK
jgi:ferritin-like metal-binding protein YciE